MNLQDYSFEELANAIYMKGIQVDREKVTDKTGWRELIIAEKLGHTAHKKISSGGNSDKYGSDAVDKNGKYGEYKSNAIVEKQIRNLLEKIKNKKGDKYVSLKVKGVYNGAYKEGAILRYRNIDHYFAVFYQEICLLIIKPKTSVVIEQLELGNAKWKPGKSTNLNTVTIDLSKTDTYDIVYDNRKYLSEVK